MKRPRGRTDSKSTAELAGDPATADNLFDSADERGHFFERPARTMSAKPVSAPEEKHYHGHRDRLRNRFRDNGDGALADYEILEQKNAACFDSIWIISKSGRSSSALNWVKALEGKEINLVCFTGDYQSPLAQAADTAFIIHDPQKFDDDIYWSNPFFGYCILGFERLLKMWFTSLRSNS